MDKCFKQMFVLFITGYFDYTDNRKQKLVSNINELIHDQFDFCISALMSEDCEALPDNKISRSPGHRQRETIKILK